MNNNVIDAIKKVKGPCVILAGAGTGKTHTIVEKIKYLIKDKIYPSEKIVCITFSNEAANSLLARVQKIIDNEKEPIIKTFHAFSADLLRKYGHKLGANEKFTILEPDDAKVILHRNLRIPGYYCHKYVESIGTAKDLGIKLEDVQNYVQKRIAEFGVIDLEIRLEQLQFELQTLHLKKDDEGKRGIMYQIRKMNNVLAIRKFVNAWGAYEKIKQKSNCLDYSDLNKYSLELLSKNPEIANDFDYVIVDEFQDTNKIQLDFLLLLSLRKDITVVGDMNQSIYRFRGAYKDNFELFKKYFNVLEKDIFTLDKSRRSSNKILRTAHKLILNNYINPEECFFVENYENRDGDKIEVYELKNAKEESRKIVEIVKNELKRGVEASEICIMFRNHMYGRVIKRALELEKIDYVSVSKGSLLKNKDVKKIICYLSVLDKIKREKSGGENAWWELIHHLGFPEEDLITIGKFMKPKNKKMENSNGNDEIIEEVPISLKLMREFESPIELMLSDQARMLSKILIDRIKSLVNIADKSISDLILEVFQSAGYTNLEKEGKTRDEQEVILNLDRFYDLAKDHSNLYGNELYSFINYLEILENLGIEIESLEIENQGVRLMTSHSTKGLEYRTVIISNLANKRFPLERININPLIPLELSPEFSELKYLGREEIEDFYKEFEKKNQLAEERRLCYVALTRAKEKLFLTYAGDYSGKAHYPSQFLNEINYRTNDDIIFAKDMDEKFIEPEIKQETRKDFITGIEIEKREVVDRTNIALSPSALRLFDQCEKQFEYKYVYNMPEKKAISWEAMQLGSFIHLILENGVNKNFKELKQFIDYAKELHLEEEWQEIELKEVEHILKVFFARNKEKYNDKSKTEQFLKTKIEGINFVGFADRIDYHNDGLEIIDYKTGKSNVSPRDRNWQLGYYAIAAHNMNLGRVKRITLDMLKQDVPLEFEVDHQGNAIAINQNIYFNINEVKDELLTVAKRVHEAYKSGFKPCPVEKNCEFCNEYVYGL